MNKSLIKYNITPRVLEADKKQVITVSAFDESVEFFDDVTYYVRITAVDEWNFKKDETYHLLNNVEEFECKCVDGVLKIEYYFAGETEWNVRIYRKENEKHRNPMYDEYGPHWANLINAPFHGISFTVYSVYEDLYKKRPFKGDLHIHTNRSDGAESPAMVAAQYRKFGFDFISITDHHLLEPSLEAIEAFGDIKTKFKVFPGEEVHNGYVGYFHVVNFNPKTSVNEILLNDMDNVKKEVCEIAKDFSVPESCDKNELAWRKWINDAIHKSGGITIFPHPYWMIDGAYHTQTKSCKAIFDMGLCDVFEVLGGTDYNSNKNQVAMYYEAKAEGNNMPIVGSSDSHTCLEHGKSHFDCAWTIVFAHNTDEIPDSILEKYTTVVDNNSADYKNVYGDLRLVKYTWFLIENYYETHDELCNSAGQAILRYTFGDKSQNKLIELLENELVEYNKRFFGN